MTDRQARRARSEEQERELTEETRRAFKWLYDAGFTEKDLRVRAGRVYLTLSSGWGCVWIAVPDEGNSVYLRAAPRGHTDQSAKSLQTLMAGQGLTPVSTRWGSEPGGRRAALERVATALRELGVTDEERLIEVDEAARNLSASEQWGANAVPPKRFGW